MAKQLSEEKRKVIEADILSAVPRKEVMQKHKISAPTYYRFKNLVGERGVASFGLDHELKNLKRELAKKSYKFDLLKDAFINWVIEHQISVTRGHDNK